jgi:cytochrome b involved in lipid metabolism
MKKIIFFVKNKKYDVTNYIDFHPGGKDCLIKYINQDVSYHYKMHSNNAKKLCKKFLISK